MNITIKRSNKENERARTIWFPIEEKSLYEICNDLGIEMTTEPKYYIENSMDKNFLRILHDKNCNIDELDGESYAMEVIRNNPNSTITPYGVLYKNGNEMHQAYDGRNFPAYQWKKTMATVELKAKRESKFIYAPCSDIEQP